MFYYTWHIEGKVAIINNLGGRIGSNNKRACKIYDVVTGHTHMCDSNPGKEFNRTQNL